MTFPDFDILNPSFLSKEPFISTPPWYPPSLQSDLIARWQGITMGKGLPASALPTARAPLFIPICFPILPYVLTHPLGISYSAERTRLWNSEQVSRAKSFRSNSTACPERKPCISFAKLRMIGFDDWQAVGKVFWTSLNAETCLLERIIRYTFGFFLNSRQIILNVPKIEGAMW